MLKKKKDLNGKSSLYLKKKHMLQYVQRKQKL